MERGVTFDEAATRQAMQEIVHDLDAIAKRARTLRLKIQATPEHKAAMKVLIETEEFQRLPSWTSALKTDVEEWCRQAASSVRGELRLPRNKPWGAAA